MWLLSLLAGCTGSPPDVDTDSGVAVGVLALDPCDPGAFDLGDLEPGGVASIAVRASNLGSADVTVTSVSIDAPFSQTAAPPLTIGPGSSTQFSVRLVPTTYGSWQGALTVAWSPEGGDEQTVSCGFSGRVRSDHDEDGFDGTDAGGDDCDDDDADVHPGAADAWYDGVDADCDGASDFDQDSDGYDASAFDADPTTGGDCQDTNPGMHPGAPDAWYDGIDADCDGADEFDRDGDGWGSSAYGGSDCDDGDANTFPDAQELYDGLDQDCDELVDDDVSASTANVRVRGVTGDRFGAALALGDWDGDSRAELAVGAWRTGLQSNPPAGDGLARGSVAVWSSTPATGDRATASALWQGATSTSELGRAVADVGDWDGDGRTDLAIGAPAKGGQDGAVYVISGRDFTTGDLSRALVTVTGRADQRLGSGIASRTDLDGDGIDDLLAAGVDWDTPYTTLGIVYGGGALGARTWDTVDASLAHVCGVTTGRTCLASYWDAQGGSPTFAQLGAGGDLDGDGLTDVVLADPLDDSGGPQAGRVWVLWGRTVQYTGAASLEGTATGLATGVAADELLGTAAGITPDDDGDGAAELWAVRGVDGAVFHLSGSPSLRLGADLEADAVAIVRPRGLHVSAFSQAGDLTGDGLRETLLAFAADGHGAVRLVASGTHGESEDFPGPASFRGDADESAFGTALAAVPGDLDGDGRVDLAFGDPEAFGGDGAVYLFTGR